METLALSSGDLVPAGGGYQTISGPDKIRQDMALALGEELGHDPYHPEWGSTLPSYVGSPLTSDVQVAIQAEVARVLAAHMAVQQQVVAQDSVQGSVSRFDTSDVIGTVNGISVTNPASDALMITASITTLAGQTVTMTKTVIA
jgi:phage baseplate assembly protein W